MTESLGYVSESLVQDNLIAGDFPIVTEQCTILNGQNLVRGTLLGKITKAAGTPVLTGTGNGTVTGFTLGKKAIIGNYIATCTAISGARTAGTPSAVTGTGNGTCGSASAGASAQVGTYRITCIKKTAGYGDFKVIGPNKDRLDDAVAGTAYTSSEINFTITAGVTDFEVGDYFTIAVTATNGNGTFMLVTPNGERLADITVGSAYASDHINLTIVDGSSDFVVGDYWTIPVAAGSGKKIKSIATAVDGSQDPESILSEDADATSADLTRICYLSGEFNTTRMTFGTGHSASSTKDDLRAKSIFLKSTVVAA